MMKLPSATRAPEVEAGGAIEEETRTKIANRDWVDASGKECDEESAVGVRYEFLGRTKSGVTVPPDGKAYTRLFSEMSEAEKNMLAGFGAITLMGNVTNTWLTEKGEKTPTAADAIGERFTLLNSGQWIDRTREGVGARVDKDALAEAITRVAIKASKVDEADSAAVDAYRTKVRAKIEDSPDWAKEIRRNGSVASEYASVLGRAAKPLDEMLAGI